MTFTQEAHRIAASVFACVQNATGLAEAARHLRGGGFHAPALCLAVLALEEVGKVFYIDGLSLAKPGDDRERLFQKAKGAHGAKLQALDFFPLFLQSVALLDTRFETDTAFKQTFVISVEEYRRLRISLSPWLGETCDLEKLNGFKQHGFYVDAAARNPVPPATAIDPKFAEAVVALAVRMSDALGCFFGPDQTKYEKRILTWRTISEKDLGVVRSVAEEIASNVFGKEPSV